LPCIFGISTYDTDIASAEPNSLKQQTFVDSAFQEAKVWDHVESARQDAEAVNFKKETLRKIKASASQSTLLNV